MKQLFLILGLVGCFIYACENKDICGYKGIWLNQNLDYIEITDDSLYFTNVFLEHTFKSKYFIKKDTLMCLGNNFFCQYNELCTLKFLLLFEKVKPLPSPKLSKQFFVYSDFFIRENKRFYKSPFDSLVIKHKRKTPLKESVDIGEVKIYNSGEIKWSGVDDENKKIFFNFSSKNWYRLKNEIMKIDKQQFKLWNEGDTSDGRSMTMKIHRKDSFVEFEGSIIPYYYQNLNYILNQIESKRIALLKKKL